MTVGDVRGAPTAVAQIRPNEAKLFESGARRHFGRTNPGGKSE
jgi:hypothetical protein